MSERKFRAGQLVTFKYGSRSVQGVVKEDRGPIGMHGRVLYLVQFPPEPQSPYVSHIELSADRLKPVEDTVRSEG
jgi:hypothetical protein